jgi:ATP-dependent DNA ligase
MVLRCVRRSSRAGSKAVVAKREREPYRPGARLWVKTKNRATARFQEELAGAQRRHSA